jgi:hypothetical protein
MKRISLEQAKQFIPLEEDFTNKTVQDCPYFTLTPSPKGDGWETVTYYTARNIDMYANRDGNYDSWVYILSNPTQPNLYKIGYTKNTPDERAKQISNAKIKVMKIRFQNPFLHITAVGMLTLTLITGGLLGVFYAFIFGLCLGQLRLNAKEKQNEEL